MMMNRKPASITGLSDVVDLYDAFLVDQWGVLHDGIAAYDGVTDALRALKAHGKSVIILTNSAKTKAANVARLAARFSIGADLYTHMVSSAELLRDLIATSPDEPWVSLGRRVYLVADRGDEALLDGTPLECVDDIARADFVLLLSVAPGETAAEHRHWIDSAATRRLVVACPSADLLSVSTAGVVTGLATLGEALLARGARVLNVGKPESPVYELCARLLTEVPPSRILAIGDQIGSDCAGANRHGMASALVCTGATGKTFPGVRTPDGIAAAAAAVASDCVPMWVMPTLRW